MINWGAVPANSVLPFFFGSYDGATGASEAITGLAVTDIEVYKGTSMTQRASDNGYALLDTDGIDIDGHVGINGFSIDTSDNSDAGFYTAGSFYTVVVASITADAQTVNFVAGTFRIVAADQTGDSFARLGTPAGASVSADIAAIKSDTAAILVDTGTTLDGKIDTIDTNVDAILADTGTDGVVVASIAAGAVNATAIANGAIDAATFAAGAIDAAAIAADAGAELADVLLNRDMSTGTDSGSATVRTVRQALRLLRNKVGVAGGTLTVTKEDDSTASWTAAVTTAAGDPISEIDPASA